MAKLTKDEVLHVAKLANLSLSEAEVEKFATQLSGVIDHIGQLSEVDTAGVEPTSQTTGLENVSRDDKVVSDASLSQEQATSGTDKTYNGYFKVEAILKERTDK